MIGASSTDLEARNNLRYGVSLFHKRDAAADKLTIAGGIITGVKGGRIFMVDTESDGATDNLDTISWDTGHAASLRDGAVIAITPANTARTVVLTKAGNIDAVSPIAINGTNQFAILMWNAATSKWQLIWTNGARAGSETAQLASGVVEWSGAPVLLVDSEVDDASDNLDTINASNAPLEVGTTIRIQCTAVAEPVVLTKAGNINHASTTITLDALTEYAMVMWDGTKFQVISHNGTAA